MRARGRALIVSASIAAFGGCGLSVTGKAEDPAVSGSDADVDASSQADGASSNDVATRDENDLDPPVGGGDAAPDGPVDGDGCTILIDDSFTTEREEWDRLGNASFDTPNGRVILSPKNVGGSAGAIWWKAPLSFTGRLHVVLDIQVDASGVTPGDGMTMAWVRSTTKYVLGSQSQSFGICNSGLVGVAVAADSRDDQLNLVGSVSGNCGTENGVQEAPIVTATQIIADFQPTSLRATINTIATSKLRDDVTIDKNGYFGLTAATGGGEALHAVTAVKVTSCPQ